MFGDNTMFDTLDQLPKPDLIIASPPCESWSNASSMGGDGNACWIEDEDLVTVKGLKQEDPVKKPSHYQGRDGLEAIEVMRQFAPCPEYVEGGYWTNVLKYTLRYHRKNGVEDLKKARQNLDWLIEEMEK